MIRVGVLTSSRADYGIYLPLLKAIEQDSSFELRLIVFGTHLSKFHGYTLKQINQDGFLPYATLESLLIGDTPNAISSSYALTNMKFADFWNHHQNEFDIVFALGDRFEMAAAIAAAVPYGMRIAHLHGGETTLGAIDNIYRHSISLASTFHFVATDVFVNRIQNILDIPSKHVYNIGSLSLENLENLPLLTQEEFTEKWNIDLNEDCILVTVHPETVAFDQNERYCAEISTALRILAKDYQIIITMPNADTSGIIYRNSFEALGKEFDTVKIIENFGTQSYFTCMKYAQLLIGNTSSGIVEAASFGKYVLNVGDRQKGRLAGDNVIHIPFQSEEIIEQVKHFCGKVFEGSNPYYQAKPSARIIEILKQNHASFS
jgi:GDP/UDP-N,N'-diacetylbacillosamine 2-epimerase (hydrolysing)